MASCPRCAAPAGETARFCSACGAALPGPPAAAPARKVVTVMFADVSGFTALAERHDPESLQQVMNRYFAVMREVVGRHGGIVAKVLGDAVMVLFGVPAAHEDDATRAARCSLEMHVALDALNDEIQAGWGERLRTHTGIATGEVVVAPGEHGEAVVYGDPVNVARRLQESAARGDILVGAVTARLLRGARLAPVTPMRLKGKGMPVEAWRLEGLAEDAIGAAAPARALVGRRAELAALRAAFEGVLGAARPAAVTVTGPAGIGKSRLVRALLDEVGDRATVVASRCLPYGEGITYWPLAEIVRRLAGRPETAAIAAAAGGGSEARTIAHRVARVVGVAPGTVAVDEARWAVRRLFEIHAARRPLVVVMDDVHWAEPTLIDLLEHVAAVARGVPLLLISLARTEPAAGSAPWHALLAHGPEVTIGPLPDDDAAVLLAELTAGTAITAADADRVLATAEGNPFFLEQLAAMRASGEGGTPASIQALLAARIDALAPGERAVVDRAAVVGRGFYRSAVAELLPPALRAGLDAALAHLAGLHLIRPGPGELPGEAGYRFAHVLVRDVAYDLLPKAERADLHERYAAWLDARAGPRFAELVGYHLEQAHRWRAELRPSATDERRPLAVAGRGAPGRGRPRGAAARRPPRRDQPARARARAPRARRPGRRADPPRSRPRARPGRPPARGRPAARRGRARRLGAGRRARRGARLDRPLLRARAARARGRAGGPRGPLRRARPHVLGGRR